MSILGKFAVIMADPPWDIHMELPYGTMSDDEMRRLDIPCLQDDGYIFLWVTGRSVNVFFSYKLQLISSILTYTSDVLFHTRRSENRSSRYLSSTFRVMCLKNMFQIG